MKKILILFLMIFVSNGAFADCDSSRIVCRYDGYDVSDLDNLKQWYGDNQGFYWQEVGDRNLGEGDNPCIGVSNRDGVTSCETGAPVRSAPYSDEWGQTLMMAVETSIGGAKFCPTTAIGANSDNCTYGWNEYYVDESDNAGCVWLCRDGYTGPNCMTSASGYLSCGDQTQLRKSNYDDVEPISTLKKTYLEEHLYNGLSLGKHYKSVPMFKSQYVAKTSGGTMYYEHDIVFIVVGWLESGHGAWLRPYVMRNWLSGYQNNINSAAVLYPAQNSSGGGGYISRVLGCKVGYEPSDNGTDCVPINPELCGGTSDGDDGGFVGGNDDGGELPPGGGTGVCDGTLRSGVHPGTSECITCPMGQIFNRDAVNASYCEDTIKISNDVLLYGGGNSATSITNQCWTKTKLKDYKNCVKRGI